MVFEHGRCETKHDTLFDKRPFCYANLPSTCNDLEDSSIKVSGAGQKMSAQACAEDGGT